MPIDSSGGQFMPQCGTHLNAFGTESLRSLVTKERKLNAHAAQFLQIRNDLTLTQWIEHSVVRDIEDTFTRETHLVLSILADEACRPATS